MLNRNLSLLALLSVTLVAGCTADQALTDAGASTGGTTATTTGSTTTGGTTTTTTGGTSGTTTTTTGGTTATGGTATTATGGTATTATSGTTTTTTGGTTTTTTGGTTTTTTGGTTTGGTGVSVTEYLYTANNSTSNFSSFPVSNGTLEPASIDAGETVNGTGTEQITAISGDPVALAVEGNYSNVTAYSVNATTGALSFLSDQTAAIQTAITNAGLSTNFIPYYVGQYTFTNGTVAYLQDGGDGEMVALNVTTATTGQGTLSNATYSASLAQYYLNSLQLASVGGNSFLVTFEGDDTNSTDGAAEVETWSLTANGAFTANAESSSSQLQLGAASDVSASSAQYVVNGTTYMLLGTNLSSTDGTTGDGFVISIGSTGALSEVANLTVGGTNDTVGVIGTFVEPVNTNVAASGYEAVFLQADGNVTTYPIELNGAVGPATVTSGLSSVYNVTSPSNFASTISYAGGIIPSATNPNLFFVTVATTGDDYVIPVTCDPTTGVLSVASTPQSTGSTGAITPPYVNGSDASTASSKRRRPTP